VRPVERLDLVEAIAHGSTRALPLRFARMLSACTMRPSCVALAPPSLRALAHRNRATFPSRRRPWPLVNRTCSKSEADYEYRDGTTVGRRTVTPLAVDDHKIELSRLYGLPIPRIIQRGKWAKVA
jgi:hypothetical protein